MISPGETGKTRSENVLIDEVRPVVFKCVEKGLHEKRNLLLRAHKESDSF